MVPQGSCSQLGDWDGAVATPFICSDTHLTQDKTCCLLLVTARVEQGCNAAGSTVRVWETECFLLHRDRDKRRQLQRLLRKEIWKKARGNLRYCCKQYGGREDRKHYLDQKDINRNPQETAVLNFPDHKTICYFFTESPHKHTFFFTISLKSTGEGYI